MTQRPRKALIVGAGIAGPVTAIFLKKAGIDAQLFEAWPYSTGIGGGLNWTFRIEHTFTLTCC